MSAYHIKRLEGRYGLAAESIIKQTETTDCTENIDCTENTDYTKTNNCIETTDTLFSELRWALDNETVVHLEDLLLRRTRLGLLLKNGGEVLFESLKPLCQDKLGWSDSQWNIELSDYKQLINHCYGLPKNSQAARSL